MLKITLQQEPYLDGTPDEPYFTALAIDENGNQYDIIWDIVNPESDDDGDRCDWDNPSDIWGLDETGKVLIIGTDGHETVCHIHCED